jgi:hypothetical protein
MLDFLQMHLQEPEVFWFMSNTFLKRPVSLKYWLLCLCFYKEVTSKSSTKKGLLHAPEESGKEHFKCLSLDTPLWHDVMSMSLKEPAAKDFVERKAHTIALSKAQGTYCDVIKCKSRLGIAQKLS